MTNTHMAPPGAKAPLGLLVTSLIRVTGICAVVLLIQAPEVFRIF